MMNGMQWMRATCRVAKKVLLILFNGKLSLADQTGGVTMPQLRFCSVIGIVKQNNSTAAWLRCQVAESARLKCHITYCVIFHHYREWTRVRFFLFHVFDVHAIQSNTKWPLCQVKVINCYSTWELNNSVVDPLSWPFNYSVVSFLQRNALQLLVMSIQSVDLSRRVVTIWRHSLATINQCSVSINSFRQSDRHEIQLTPNYCVKQTALACYTISIRVSIKCIN